MKALVKEKPEKGLKLRKVDLPKISSRDLLVKVLSASICGTDLHIYKWDEWSQKNLAPPVIPGHEFCGEIVDMGSEAEGFKIGDRIAGEGHLTCGKCRNCRSEKKHLCLNVIGLGISRNGAFAEYVSIPAENAFLIPPNISNDLASMMDPLGNAIHTALEYNLAGEDVLITGAGPIGIMAAALCHHVGARRIVISDFNEYRLNLAKKMGATHTVNISEVPLEKFIKEMNMSEGIDIALEMSGSSQALQDILNIVRPGSPVCLLGILPNSAAIDWQKVIFKGLTLRGIYGRKMFDTWYKMIGMLSEGLHVSPILTHRFSFEEYKKAFEIMSSGLSGKVVLTWS